MFSSEKYFFLGTAVNGSKENGHHKPHPASFHNLIRSDLKNYCPASNLAFNEKVKKMQADGETVYHFGFGQVNKIHILVGCCPSHVKDLSKDQKYQGKYAQFSGHIRTTSTVTVPIQDPVGILILQATIGKRNSCILLHVFLVEVIGILPKHAKCYFRHHFLYQSTSRRH